MKKLIILVLFFLLVHSYVFSTDNIKNSTKDEILKTDKVWQQNYNQFIPDADLLNTLDEKIQTKLKIDVYLGLWCGDSEKNVPEFIKILDVLTKKVDVNYFLCERKRDKSIKFFVEKKRVIRVPTFIFYNKKVEIGRIIENPVKSLLEDFLEIVF